MRLVLRCTMRAMQRWLNCWGGKEDRTLEESRAKQDSEAHRTQDRTGHEMPRIEALCYKQAAMKHGGNQSHTATQRPRTAEKTHRRRNSRENRHREAKTAGHKNMCRNNSTAARKRRRKTEKTPQQSKDQRQSSKEAAKAQQHADAEIQRRQKAISSRERNRTPTQSTAIRS